MIASIRHAVVLFICLTAAVLIAYQTPAEYELEARLTVSGQFQPLESLPTRMRDAWQSFRKSPSEDLLCRHETPPTTTLHCSQHFQRRGSATKAVQSMEEFSTKLGWISPLALKAKLEDLREQTSRKSEERASVVFDLEHVPGLDEASSQSLKDYENKRQFLSTELDNRKRQLALIQEALGQQSESEKDTFLNKEKELQAVLADLEKDRAKLDEEFSGIQEVLQRQARLRAQKATFDAQIEEASVLMLRMESLIEQNLTSDRLEDPTTFQIQSGNREIFIRPIRNWKSLPWSVILGFFAYAFWMHGFRKRVRRPNASKTLSSLPPKRSPKDLEPWLKAPYLGEIQLRHPEVREPSMAHPSPSSDVSH